MDAGIVKDRDGVLWVREGRRLAKGDMVAVGEKEDGSDGIYVGGRQIDTGDCSGPLSAAAPSGVCSAADRVAARGSGFATPGRDRAGASRPGRAFPSRVPGPRVSGR